MSFKRVALAAFFAFQYLFAASAFGQSISGRVLDAETEEPLAGANVYIAGTTIGTATGPDGRFTLDVPERVERLTVSYVGYRSREVDIQPNLTIYLDRSLNLEELIIYGVRADADDPVSQSTVHRKELQREYNGEQPVFYLEKMTPSITSYSESGTRMVNYGSMRLRGISQERINITLNGIPLNDMIDHGVFFSNFTDISNSFESVQVQRGVGTSSNGVASYAGSVNFESVNIEGRERGGRVELGLGSFDSYRLNTSLSSGMIDGNYSLYGSYSRILSDGYRYHTGTNAYSFFFSGGYFGEKDMIKINAFDARSGNGLGYMAVAESDLEQDPRTNYLDENDKDDFGQRLVQLQHTHRFSDEFSTSASLYYGGASGDFLYTYPAAGSGLEQINFPLSNDHYGLMVNGFLETGDLDVSTGVHGYIFERVNEESFSPDFENPYYRETSDKKEFSWFGKAEWALGDLALFADVQVRTAELSIQPDYGFIGIPPEGDIVKTWAFVNPKIGLNYTFSPHVSAFASAGRMGREPTKIDIFGGFNLGPANYAQARQDNFDPEYVNDYEAGVKLSYRRLSFNANIFYMDFNDEIAPIGEVIAFGVQKRRNIPESYRAGIELEWNYLPVDLLALQGTLTYMRSEIESFTTGAGNTFTGKTPILSPDWIVNGGVHVYPLEGLTVSLTGKYVSESYLELTNDPQMVLPSYFVVDAAAGYELGPVSLKLELNNLTDHIYYSGGAPVDTDFDGINDEPGYFVNAGRNFFLALTYEF